MCCSRAARLDLIYRPLPRRHANQGVLFMSRIMRSGIPLIILVGLVAGGCSRSEPAAAPPATESIVIPAKTPESSLSESSVKSFAVTPATIGRAQQATVTMQFHRPVSDTELIVSWFRPDGWNVIETVTTVNGTGARVPAPSELLSTPGVYRVELRDGLRHLAEATLTVA